jgi:hypothetical protein
VSTHPSIYALTHIHTYTHTHTHTAVELNSYCEFWYEFGLKLAAIAEERNLYETLQVAYGARFVHIIEKVCVRV